MRSTSLVPLVLLGGSLLVACEDGPKQTYVAPAAGAASVWNNGLNTTKALPNGNVLAGSQGFGSTSASGDNANTICDATQLKAQWAKMFVSPIVIPNQAANLNLAGVISATDPTVTYKGVTIEQAQAADFNCQSTNIGDAYGDGNETDYWGDNEEVLVEYFVSTHKIFHISLQLGYLGTMDFSSTAASPYGAATYKLGLGLYIEKTDATGTNPMTLPFVDFFNGNPTSIQVFDALYWAIMQTYFPSFTPDPPGTTCTETGRCEIASLGGGIGYFFIPSIGWDFFVYPYTDPVATNKPIQVDIDLTQIMDFSFANPIFKLDSTGPITYAAAQGGPQPCSLGMGLLFSDFLNDCVETDADPSQNPSEFAKLVSGLSHGDQDYSFNVPGVDLNFTDASLGATDVVLDYNPPANGIPNPATAPPNTLPQPTDFAEEFSADQSTLGLFGNDYTPDFSVQDLHGAGQLYDEYRRLIITNVYQESGLPIYPENDPQGRLPTVTSIINDCLAPVDPTTGQLPPNFDPAAWLAGMEVPDLPNRYQCTGVEGLLSAATYTTSITPNMTSGSPTPANLTDRVNIGPTAVEAINGNYSLGMKMGHQTSTVCMDAMSQSQMTAASTLAGMPVLPQYCAAPYGSQGDIIPSIAARVVQVFGGGNVLSMPADIRDNRFFFKMYSQALLKVLEHAATDNSAQTTVDAEPIDFNALFFDSIGAGQFENMEYVDRRFASATQAPLDIVFTADVKDGIMNDYDLTRYLTRGEVAMYTGLQATNGSTPVPLGATGGFQPAAGNGPFLPTAALLTNIFGSPMLAANWVSYACAITPDNEANQTAHPECKGKLAPSDASNNELLDPDGNPLLYGYPGAWMPTAFALGTTTITVNQTFPFTQHALVTVPTFTNPYDPTTNSGTFQALVPWLPSQPGSGFPVAVSGVLDQFVQTSSIDFTGTTITANVDYNLVANPSDPSGQSQVVQELGVESSDFLGDLFLCQEGKDILSARMYTPVEGIVQWLAAHPQSFSDCGIIIRYSPFDNYVDYITSLTNGVRLSVTQGGGYGRVVDAILFVPGQYGNQ